VTSDSNLPQNQPPRMNQPAGTDPPPDAGGAGPQASWPKVSTAPSPQTRRLGHRVEVDQAGVQRGLASLVLTIVELLRQLMERQALRRVDQGDLSEEQVERIGATLLALDEQMVELREHFGLTPEDLNLDLGPLGPLLPRE
jgi:hypothetical protein